MRICLLTERLAPPFDEGFKNVVLRLGEGMARQHEVLTLTCDGQDVPSRGIRNIAANRFLLSFTLARMIRRWAPDVLYYVPTASLTWPSFLRARVLRTYIPAGGHIALVGLQPRPHTPLSRRLVAALAPDLLLVMGRHVTGGLPPLRCPVVSVPAGVDTARFTPATAEEKARLRAAYGIPPAAWVLLHVGHIKQERNVQLLGRIQQALGVQTLMVGSSSTTQERQVEGELRAAGVMVISRHLDIVEAYRLADAYLFPTRLEQAAIGVPLSVLEAMACNLPVIATPFGGLPELFPAQPARGLIYAETDDALVTAVAAARQHVGADTRALVLPYSWPQVAETTITQTTAALGLP